MQNEEPPRRKLSWIFALHCCPEDPDGDNKEHRVLQLVTTHDDAESLEVKGVSDGDGGSDTRSGSDDDSVAAAASKERRSLLQGGAAAGLGEDGSKPVCWTFSGPFGSMFHSSILLRLHYRPAWQSIPEYTRKQSSRMSRLLGCCLQSNHIEHICEEYTSQSIVDTRMTTISIRGMGKCRAIQVYLRPHQHADGDTSTLLCQNALEAHKRRLQHHQANLPTWTRFTCPSDTVCEADDSDVLAQNCQNIVLTFAMPKHTEHKYDPPLLWKVSLPKFRSDFVLDHLTVLDGKIKMPEPPTHVYVQGYQSWTYAGSIAKGQPQPKSAMPDFVSKAFNHGGTVPAVPTVIIDDNGKRACSREDLHHLSPKSKYQSDFFTCITTDRNERIDEIGGPAVVFGWLSQHKQFGVISVDGDISRVRMHAYHGGIINERIEMDWAYGQMVAPHFYDEEPMIHYLHAVAAYHQSRPLRNGPLLTGWCSWYHYYENISAVNLRANFAKLNGLKKRVPTNVTVVDDGYMTAWGDWDSLKPGKFTDLTAVSGDITAHDMRPGLWMAPFACDKHSKLAKCHPDWIIYNDRGWPANSSNCGKWFYGLDATNPEVRAYVHECVRRAVEDWGFNVLKIDFLYAACLEGNSKYDMSMSRAEAMHLAMQTIRQAAGPDVFLIGCGCPIGSGIGYVDGMRISADTGPTWYPAFPLPKWDYGTIPSLKAMIRNSINRAPMGHRWWHNDPDCLLLGESTSLRDAEVASAASIVAMTCGMMLLSDDMSKVSLTRMLILTKIFPMTGSSAVVLDLHTTCDGLPSYLRLWCTDQFDWLDKFRQSSDYLESREREDHNAEATYFGMGASFSPDEPQPHPNERRRSCIHVANGLGTWTLLSVSNWNDKARTMFVPEPALSVPPEVTMREQNQSSELSEGSNGYHVFAFWSSRYSWIPDGRSDDNVPRLSKHLGPHETEIFHIKPVIPGLPQYIGSDFHFSCGYEVVSFRPMKNGVIVLLKADLKRVGKVFLFIPTADTSHVKVTVNGKPSRWFVVGNTPNEGSPNCIGRVIAIPVTIEGDKSSADGQVVIEF